MSELELFPERRIGGDLVLFPVIDRRTAPPSYLRRKPRTRAVLAKQPPCPTCGGVVGPTSRTCGSCHFAGWWEPGCIGWVDPLLALLDAEAAGLPLPESPRFQPPRWVVETAEARVEAAREAGEEWVNWL